MEKVWDFYRSVPIEGIRHNLKAVKSVFFLCLVSFFIGRVVLFGFMNPLAPAFLAGFIGRRQKVFIIALSMAIGIITRFEGLLIIKHLSVLSLILSGHMFISLAGLKAKGVFAVWSAGFATLAGGLLFAFLFGGGIFFYLTALGGSVFAVTLTVLTKEGVALLSGRHKENLVDNEGVISLIIILGAAVAGAADIYIGIIAFKYVTASLIVLIGARRGGVSTGAACGVSLGFILTLTSSVNYPLIGVLSVGGMAAGFFKNTGKPACLAAFLAGALLSALYLDTGLIDRYFISSSALAAVLFAAVSDNFSVSLTKISPEPATEEAVQIKALVHQRLLSAAASFNNMGRIFEAHSEKKQGPGRKELARLIDDTAAKACGECRYKDDCWGKDFYKTYQLSLNILEELEKSKEVSIYKPEDEDPCKYPGYFSGRLSHLYDMYKLNLTWQNRVCESRQLVAAQLLSVSEIIENLSLEIKERETLSNYLSENIVNSFAKKNIEVRDVIVLENAGGKFTVSLERSSCRGGLNCFKEAAKLVSNCMGRKMAVDTKGCRKGTGSRSACRLSFTQEARFRVVSGAAYAKKDGSEHSGDSHSVMEIRANQIILALSDGMGSGKKARAESEAAMGLLEDFLEAGFSRELALRLINSVLVLKDGSEHFATMDICAIDLHTGTAEFVKAGAAAAFIKRGTTVARIASESLPMGILSDIDAGISKKTLKNGDLIVMVTDGVHDSGADAGIGRNWIAEALTEYSGKDPQDIADYLIALAVKREGGKIADDMTVLCARVWEKLS